MAGVSAIPGEGKMAEGAQGAYKIALEGGKHSGFLKNYLAKSTSELKKGIASIERQISEHQAKIVNPSASIPGFSALDPRQQRALIESKWPSDIARQKEQLEILRGLAADGK
jgi:hypothetical protein